MPGKPDAIYPICSRAMHRLRRIGQALGDAIASAKTTNARWTSVGVSCRGNGWPGHCGGQNFTAPV